MFRRKKGVKYNNIKIITDGIKFDSKIESKYYSHLKELESKNEIQDLKLQPCFILQDNFETKNQFKMSKKDFNTLSPVVSNKTKRVNLIRKMEYIADFQFFDKKLNKTIIADTKGFQTTDYKIKKKLFLNQIKNREDVVFLEIL
jgi:hypothetical protein